jgi:mRNA interferase RelE/StbE
VSYEVRIARQAERYLHRLPRNAQQRILLRLRQIGDDPHGPHTKPLHGLSGRRAARVGGWRIIFAVDEEHHTVDVSVIGPRGDVYRDL